MKRGRNLYHITAAVLAILIGLSLIVEGFFLIGSPDRLNNVAGLSVKIYNSVLAIGVFWLGWSVYGIGDSIKALANSLICDGPGGVRRRSRKSKSLFSVEILYIITIFSRR